MRYERITKDFKELDVIEEIYNNAFPSTERLVTIDEAKSMDEKGLLKSVQYAVYDGDQVVGFYSLTNNEGYQYLNYIAVSQKIRNKGYGGEILKHLLKEADGILFASIEKPVFGEPDYEIKLRRQKFYERNGMITVDYEVPLNGVKFIAVTNKTGKDFDRYYELEMKNQQDEIERLTLA